MNSEKEVAASLPVGVRRTARHVCWAARGELVAAIVEFESEQAGFPFAHMFTCTVTPHP